jgi:hypothetical protein
MKSRLLAVLLAVLASACSKDNPTKPSAAAPRKVLSFALQPAIPVTNLISMTVGDFNGDGKADLVGSAADSIAIYLMLGKGDGSFGQPSRIPFPDSAGEPLDILAGDFDNDGHADLACNARGTYSRATFLYGRGDGTFDVMPIIGDNGSVFQGMAAVGDFNGDKIDDYAAVHEDSIAVYILPRRAGFPPTTVSYTPPGPTTVGYVKGFAADINGDGSLDFATPEGGQIAVYYGWGNGTLQAPIMLTGTTFDQGASAIASVAGGTGKDLAVAHGLAGTLGVYRRQSGTFVPEVTYPVGSEPERVGAADFDADGIEDIAVSSRGTNNAAILLGKGDGTFEPTKYFNAGSSPDQLVIGDFNRDGLPDIAFSGLHAVYILLNTSK